MNNPSIRIDVDLVESPYLELHNEKGETLYTELEYVDRQSVVSMSFYQGDTKVWGLSDVSAERFAEVVHKFMFGEK